MFDPRDIGEDPRQQAKSKSRSPATDDARQTGTIERRPPAAVDPRQQERRERTGHRREYLQREGDSYAVRMGKAIADVGVYRCLAVDDLAEARFDGHPYVTRRAVDRMVKNGLMQQHSVQDKNYQTYRVVSLTEKGQQYAQSHVADVGLNKDQQTWAGLVKRGELSHDTAIYGATRKEEWKLSQQGSSVTRIRLDAELKQEVARATETARARDGKEAADAARFQAAEDMGLPVKDGEVLYPDAQLEYIDIEGRTGRVNVEVVTDQYKGNVVAAKAAAGFQMHGNGHQAERLISQALNGGGRRGGLSLPSGGGKDGHGRGGGRGRDQGTVEL